MTFWAHSDRLGLAPDTPGSLWQPLADHLRNVSILARKLSEHAAPQDSHFHDLAERCGLLHDYGKYSNRFQRMITLGEGKCPHAIHGAVIARHSLNSPHIAAAVAGHHAGIPDLRDCGDKIRKNRDDAESLRVSAMADSPELGQLLAGSVPSVENIGRRFELLTRMLFSCLVDADRLDTAGRSAAQAPLRAEEHLQRLLDYIGQLGTDEDGAVNIARRRVLADCLRAASFPERLLSLSVPTGGGKTLSAMAFALQRAALQPDHYRRIIVVIPYLSIIEQNAQVYADIFGKDSVLEHHCGSFVRLKRADDEHFALQVDEQESYTPPFHLPETENWDAPFIVTTSVRFFESLFSNHPSDARRIHNIARSIVILDEVQLLPRNLLGPLLGMIRELAEDWGCTFVLSTATQPAFEGPAGHEPGLRWKPGMVREIVEAPEELHSRLRRVTIDWRIQEPVVWTDVAAWMLEHSQSLCVVNLRDHASRLYDEIAQQGVPKEALFHLSTRMCAAHRLQVIAQAKERLRADLPCVVVSTQLIEAGVDLDFPVAFRALGPLDSIIQVAGRVDREGRLTAQLGTPGGRLVVFRPVDHRTPPDAYKNATGITEVLAADEGRDIQPDDLGAIEQFFESHYASGDLGANLAEMRKRCEFKTLALHFEFISSRTRDVYVPFGEGRALIETLMRAGTVTAAIRRALQRFTVGLHPWELGEATSSVLYHPRDNPDVWVASESAYNAETGLLLSVQPDDLIV